MQAGMSMTNFSVQPQSSAADGSVLFDAARQSLLLVASLRSGIIKTHEFLSEAFETGAAELDLNQFKEKLEKMSQEIANEYDRLEVEAKRLPAQTPLLAFTNRLNQFMLDVATNTSTWEAYTNTRDAFDWSSYTGDYLNYGLEFLKSSNQNQRGKKPLSQLFAERSLTQYSALENPHRRFEEAFRTYIKSQDVSRVLQYTYKHLEKSAISSVLEIKLISMYNAKMYKGKEQQAYEYVPMDKQVCTMKMLLLVNNGVFEYIQFIAPHEDWTYLETNKNQIDLSAESQYELYQRLTVQGNILISMITSTSPCDKNGIKFLLTCVSMFNSLDQPCRQCKKILKDFCPATLSDNRKLFFHLTCK